MGVIRVAQTFPGTVSEAERCWYDTGRWSRWVDGLDQVLAVDSGWPATGAAVTWESGPAGRGRVTERVLAHEPLRGQTLAVTDASIEAEQSVTFTPDDGTVEVALALEYHFRKRSLTLRIIDPLFIRRAMVTSLGATLARFGAELETSRTGRSA
ncbi:MAG: SRPBCC family protein [Solirubrobacteraceae bacterium]